MKEGGLQVELQEVYSRGADKLGQRCKQECQSQESHLMTAKAAVQEDRRKCM